jgi:hypothetical protein
LTTAVIEMKTLLSLLLVILLSSSAQAQQVQEDIERAIVNLYSKTGKSQLVKVTQFGQASPSKEFIDKYNPKRTYCVKCDKDTGLIKVRGIVHFSNHPPTPVGSSPFFKEGKREPLILSDHHIAVITQSGEIELINIRTLGGSSSVPQPPIAPPPPVVPPMPKERPPKPTYMPPPPTIPIPGAAEFKALWQETCPFPMDDKYMKMNRTSN